MSVIFIADAPAIGSLSFVASGSSADVSTVTIPGSSAAGDIAFLVDTGGGFSPGPVKVVPSGWTEIAESTPGSGGTRTVTSYKVLTAGDISSPSVTGMAKIASGDMDKLMLVFRPDVPINTVAASTWNAPTSTNSNPPAQSVLASAGIAPLIVFGVLGSNNPALTFNASTLPALTVVTARYVVAGYKIYSASPADHVVDMDDLGSQLQMQSGYLSFA